MSREKPDRKPLIAIVHNLDRAFAAHMVRAAHTLGRTELKPSHNFVFGVLGDDGDRSADMAARAGITRQSMGEAVRELVDLGVLEMVPDPRDRRAKIVRYTDEGKAFAGQGFRHLRDLESRFEEEFGADYEATRTVLERVTSILAELDEELDAGRAPGQG
ncbi:MAG TPA: MarR family winged helix-turn-helix transcriptional regulator [Nocardioides sp.]|uniref:MarR family winged helix-turn-helix transcriptional regulator n=1 Tax=Nocardioides sp. TaxID=35761 RepID=UPI002E36C217|nr:MarR family winged helix-turn-helix transcriptional regulator [Nocardioides sp.]HEX5090731.1 MarR family winged helix-turn-helix transcriptional regulator [Nocardioides sp.]